MRILRLTAGALLTAAAHALAASTAHPVTIDVSRHATPLEILAAREVHRYVWSRTGESLALRRRDTPGRRAAIVIARKDRPIVGALGVSTEGLGAGEYTIATRDGPRGRTVALVGGDDVGTLYAAYRFAEHLGVRFFLHGDLVPSGRTTLDLPPLDERGVPRFATRGILPFHDFPEGPDWWNRDDYLAVVAQLPKLRMNFIGFHTYPENGPNAEPTVWTGLPGDVGTSGRVRFAYPSSYYTTARAGWGYEPRKTSSYRYGASALFDRDDFGSDVMRGAAPEPTTPATSKVVVRRAARLLRDAFRFARRLGVATCVGTEIPLTVPASIEARAHANGPPAGQRALARRLYEGIFERIARAYPIDYYWLWTPEWWHWTGPSNADVTAALHDVQDAADAAAHAGVGFTLATSGWVLGAPGAAATFAAGLPPRLPMSALNGDLGTAAVDPGFAALGEHPGWAISWLEDDLVLAATQLWVTRTLRDVADAARYGADGVIGLHWRTRAVGPAVAALAHGAWQTPDDVAGSATRFYADWSEQSFGANVAADVARIFAGMDSRLPWNPFPSAGIEPPITEDVAIADALAAVRPHVIGAGNTARLDEWIHMFAYQRAELEAQAAARRFEASAAALEADPDPAARRFWARRVLVPMRREIVNAVHDVYRHLLAYVASPGDLGTIAHWEQRILPGLLDAPGARLEALLGEPLSADLEPSTSYEGPLRVIVPTVRGSVFEGERLHVRALVLSSAAPRTVRVRWRRPDGRFHTVPLRRLRRGVYVATLPAATSRGTMFEYHVDVVGHDGTRTRFPADPAANASVVVAPWTASAQ